MFKMTKALKHACWQLKQNLNCTWKQFAQQINVYDQNIQDDIRHFKAELEGKPLPLGPLFEDWQEDVARLGKSADFVGTGEMSFPMEVRKALAALAEDSGLDGDQLAACAITDIRQDAFWSQIHTAN